MSRLRDGRANTARGAAHFLRETVGRVCYGGARGQLTVRADSGFYAHTVVAACREMDVRFSIAIRQRARLRNLIEAIPEEDWTPIPYWMDGAADVAETTYTPFQAEADAAPVRLICPAGEAGARFSTGSLRHLQLSRLHHRPGWGDAGTGGRSSPSRRDRECDTRPQVRRGAEPSPLGPLRRQRRRLAVQVMAHNLDRWTARIGLGQQIVTTKTLRRRVFALAGRYHPLGTPPHFASPPALALGGAVQPRPGPAASHSIPA